jgi:hypothetical protein
MMEQKDDELRGRLLAQLPRPEDLADYREETAALLARHKRALFWERFTAVSLSWLGFALWLTANSTWGPKLDVNQKIVFETFAGILIVGGGFAGVGYRIGQCKVDLLKELKQVQLQVLEVQAKLEKDCGPRS